MIEVRIGNRSYGLGADGQPIIPPGKYPPGDCRRLGPQYVHFQTHSRSREEKRGRLTEHAKKQGFVSVGALLRAMRLNGGERAPKHVGRTKALARDARRQGARRGA